MKTKFRFLPYMRFTIHCKQSPSQIASILATNTLSLQDLNHYDDRKSFIGTVHEDRFRLYLKASPHIRNSFRPIIKGKIKGISQGADITVTLRPTLFVILFMTVWLGCVLFAFLFSLFNLLFDTAQKDLILLFGSAAMLLFGYLLMHYGFLAPATQTHEILLTLFQHPDEESSSK